MFSMEVSIGIVLLMYNYQSEIPVGLKLKKERLVNLSSRTSSLYTKVCYWIMKSWGLKTPECIKIAIENIKFLKNITILLNNPWGIYETLGYTIYIKFHLSVVR